MTLLTESSLSLVCHVSVIQDLYQTLRYQYNHCLKIEMLVFFYLPSFSISPYVASVLCHSSLYNPKTLTNY